MPADGEVDQATTDDAPRTREPSGMGVSSPCGSWQKRTWERWMSRSYGHPLQSSRLTIDRTIDVPGYGQSEQALVTSAGSRQACRSIPPVGEGARMTRHLGRATVVFTVLASALTGTAMSQERFPEPPPSHETLPTPSGLGTWCSSLASLPVTRILRSSSGTPSRGSAASCRKRLEPDRIVDMTTYHVDMTSTSRTSSRSSPSTCPISLMDGRRRDGTVQPASICGRGGDRGGRRRRLISVVVRTCVWRRRNE